ncbi:MOSC N-terminal beta barrel domain-containing protein [filamentous cyanobacterium LEGE 11480]|uniref:MOSC N-terminal beta barrel domain-containing protein n=1 Tax=Romeriopsis navalis LEGE 11480 TaxID=2777977 RepID=A0A928Z0E9_9CYAN|nr:MOSC N-terminal beta barrel domain-containing protein [Romeriopsis navalis]MBE9028201.1 MOSC N-terminal beta barrel domain-containing protein [Romeriopsis navalis LEGE 11480]
MTPKLDRIILFPIKSLDGVEVESAMILPSGALKHDREFAIVDAGQKIVNAKRTAKIQQLRSTFNLDTQTISIGVQSAAPVTFDLTADQDAFAAWLSNYFGFAVHLSRNTTTGFPDDLDSPGPTIISTASLETVSQWYPGTNAAEMRRRFRSNLELSGVPAFWEDQLFGIAGVGKEFTIGDIKFHGINPCQRCIVPTRDSNTATPTQKFQKIFLQHRAASLPDSVNRDRFNHFYRLAVNTQIPASEAGKTLNLQEFCRVNE